MRRYLVYLLMLIAAGCAPGGGSNEAETIVIEDGMNYFGKKINEKNAVDLPEFDVLAGNTDTLYVKLRAGISDVCQEDGCWFRINLHSGGRMLVTFQDNGFVIPPDVAGKRVLIEGKSYLETVPEDLMKQYAKQAGELQWIIDTIQDAQIQRRFIASGVVIAE